MSRVWSGELSLGNRLMASVVARTSREARKALVQQKRLIQKEAPDQGRFKLGCCGPSTPEMETFWCRGLGVTYPKVSAKCKRGVLDVASGKRRLYFLKCWNWPECNR